MGMDVLHVVEDDGWTCIGTFELDVDVAEGKTVDVAGKESVSGTLAEELGYFRIFGVEFWIRLGVSLLYTATVAQLYVAQTDVFNRMTRHTRDLYAREGIAVVGNDVADADVAG